MKKLLIVCGAGHATSTIAVAKVSAWLEKEGYSDKTWIIGADHGSFFWRSDIRNS